MNTYSWSADSRLVNLRRTIAHKLRLLVKTSVEPDPSSRTTRVICLLSFCNFACTAAVWSAKMRGSFHVEMLPVKMKDIVSRSRTKTCEASALLSTGMLYTGTIPPATCDAPIPARHRGVRAELKVEPHSSCSLWLSLLVAP